jgi:hypothetical protein
MLVAAGCFARVEPTPTDTPDAPPGSGDGPPSTPDAALGPWGAATAIPGASTPGMAEDDLTLRDDELELIFAARPPGENKHLYVATRADLASAWSTPISIDELTSAGTDQSPRFSDDALTLYYGTPGPGGDGDVYMATRGSLGAPWQSPVPVPGVNSGDEDRWYGRCLGGTRYVMISNRGGNQDIYEGAVGEAPVRVAEVASAASELGPSISADCLTLYFSSDRTGDFELYQATRPSVTAAWTLIGPLADFNLIDEDEQDPWLSPDQRRMYFASTRDAEFDLFVATR